MPEGQFGSVFTGTLRGMDPGTIYDVLEAARRTNTRILVSFVGNEKRYVDEAGHFSMTIWKSRVSRFRHIDLSSYVADGTIVGHYIMDEPSDRTNWGGTVVTAPEIDEMARFSKEIWPTMPTLIRGHPHYLKGYQYKYLDAAWSQYHSRFGDLQEWMSENVQYSKDTGLALVGGMNVLAGGGKTGIPGVYKQGLNAMTAEQLRSWGATMLAEPYFCAFILWMYWDAYFSRPEIQAALRDLAATARSLPKKTCKAR